MATRFKSDFLFGTATSSYQIEGAVNTDGRTPSIWDIFSKTPGKIYKGDSGDIACDHYNRFRKDIELMKELGIEAYRFSISWSRIFPEKGVFNPKGMEFYKNLVDELARKNIEPAATLYHWDLPLWVYNMGGWLNRDSVKWFTEYSVKIFEELGDSVRLWITHNEPLCSSIFSYYEGKHAPGHKNLQEALMAAHHILISHGHVVKEFRKHNLKSGEIGITLNQIPVYPATKSKEDMEAANICDGYFNRWFLDPIFKGSYPEDMEKIYRELNVDFNFIEDDDLHEISVRNDFLGVNYYSRDLVKYSPDSILKYKKVSGKFARTEMDWEIVPAALYELIIKLRKEYTKIPIYITENGAAFDDKLLKKGEIRDKKRIDYLRRHLLEVAKLNKKRMDIRGYFLWTLMDNFEWQEGYSKRFGIIYVDFKTQERIFKNSAFWYRDLIKSRTIK
jgi:beta-glucosidase